MGADRASMVWAPSQGAKRRKLTHWEQDPAQCWQHPPRSWSPADSDVSTDTCACSPSCLLPTSAELLAGGSVHAQLPGPVSELRPSRDHLTPPSQRLAAPQQHPAPQLRTDFSRPHSAVCPQQPLPAAGSKRYWLESQTIAERIGRGRALPREVNVQSHSGAPHGWSGCSLDWIASVHRASGVLQPRRHPAKGQAWAASFGCWTMNAAHPFVTLRPTAMYATPPPVAKALELAPPAPLRPCIPRALATATQLLEHWASALQLVPDSVRLTLHMHGRLTSKMRPLAPGQGVLLLLGCLWLAAKHEECRVALPTASRLVALVGGSAVLSPAALNRAELLVLDLLGWQPLLGWDDRLHLKGRLRPGAELLEADWWRLSAPPAPAGWL